MELQGTIKSVGETKEYGSNGFRKREMVITTAEQYPQDIIVEFVQDKCDVLNGYQIGTPVTVGINIRGREWANPNTGEVKYFNTIQGWRIQTTEGAVDLSPAAPATAPAENDDDLPF